MITFVERLASIGQFPEREHGGFAAGRWLWHAETRGNVCSDEYGSADDTAGTLVAYSALVALQAQLSLKFS